MEFVLPRLKTLAIGDDPPSVVRLQETHRPIGFVAFNRRQVCHRYATVGWRRVGDRLRIGIFRGTAIRRLSGGPAVPEGMEATDEGPRGRRVTAINVVELAVVDDHLIAAPPELPTTINLLPERGPER